jgi:peptidoglycan/LPS O-acetylase OafA/YrhL
MGLEAAVGTGVSVLAAAASFDVFEKRFLRLKDRLAPSALPAGVRSLGSARPAV